MNYKEKLNKIKAFVFDVDGVFTDGKVYLFEHDVVRAFHSKDGYAVQYAVKHGFTVFIVTGGNSTEVQKRLENLGVTKVYLRAQNKAQVMREIISQNNLLEEQILYMGDDIPDIPALKMSGVKTCPNDACIDVKKIVDYQSPLRGGKGCVRDVIEQTLRVQEKWLTDMAYEW